VSKSFTTLPALIIDVDVKLSETFPWWPAVFYEDNHEDIPDGIVAQKEQLSSQGNGPWYIVRFYDKMNSW
jgi:hypothetical protein